MRNISEVVMNRVVIKPTCYFCPGFPVSKQTSLKLSSYGNRSGRFVIIAANKSCVLFLNHL